MAKLKIFPLDDPKEENASVLVNGEHTIGRGFLNCHDKRVSRKHALITISDDSILLKAVHVNPCFYKKPGEKITILPKDTSILLADGDQFSLLADDFWFKVKIIKENEDTNAVPASDTLLNSTPSTSKRTREARSEDEHSKRFKVGDNGDTSNPGDASPERVKSNLSAMLDTMLRSSSDAKMENAGSIDSNQLMNTLSSIVKEDYGENSDKENLQATGKKEVKPNLKTDGEDLGSEAGASGSVKTEDSGDKTDQNENVAGKTETGDDKVGTSADKGKASSSNDDNNKTRRERCWYGPTCYRRNPIHRADFSHPGDEDFDSDPDDDRPPCPFGGACYRKNMLHRRQYKHPNPPAPKQNDGGVTAKKKRRPTDDNSGSGDSDDDSGNQTRRKRKAATKKVNYDSPGDDYDHEDPFIDDASSDEFKISSDDSDDSTDWEDSQKVDEESQETRRLLKEAKKFTKGKGKK